MGLSDLGPFDVLQKWPVLLWYSAYRCIDITLKRVSVDLIVVAENP